MAEPPSVGTDGDCFPVFLLAREMKRRGHRVSVMAPPVYAANPVLEGVAFLPLCTLGEYERFIADAGMLAGRYGLWFCRDHAVRWNVTAWRAMESNAHDLLVLAPDQPFFWADVAAKIDLGCDAVRFQIDPPNPITAAVMPKQLPYGRVQAYLGATLAMSWRQAAAEAGLSGHGASLASLSAARSSVPAMALWPRWLVGEENRISGGVRHFGFLLNDSHYPHCMEAGNFPGSGYAIFKQGRTDSWPRGFYRFAMEVCQRLGMRGLLLGGTRPTGDLPAGILWRQFVPLDQALRHARVIVHNGGIGTAAAAIRSGVPQIIVPRWIAQPAIGDWMRWLGVAMVIQPDRYNVGTLCREISRLSSSGHRTRSLELAARIDSASETSANICQFLESVKAGGRTAEDRVHTEENGERSSGLEGHACASGAA